MGAPEPRANPLLLGHESAETTILDAFRTGRMHHAWLITGPEGIGKATLAYRFARRLLAGMPDAETLALEPTNPVFRRIAAQSHADLLTVERGFNERTKRMRTQIAVEDVRKINGFMALTPAEGGWRVVIVDGAEELNQASANALLKILEEPPPRAILLLVCAAPAAAADGRLVTLSEGSPGRAMTLNADEGLAVAALVDKLLGDMPTVPLSRGHEIADFLGRSETGFSTYMDLLRSGISASVREAVRGRADPDQQRLMTFRSYDAWSVLWQDLTRLQNETERFALDKRQAIVASVGLLTGG